MKESIFLLNKTLLNAIKNHKKKGNCPCKQNKTKKK